MTSQNLRSGRRTAITFLGVFAFDAVMFSVSLGSWFSLVWLVLALAMAAVLAGHLRPCARCRRRSLGRFFYVTAAAARTRVCVDCLSDGEFAAFLTGS